MSIELTPTQAAVLNGVLTAGEDGVTTAGLVRRGITVNPRNHLYFLRKHGLVCVSGTRGPENIWAVTPYGAQVAGHLGLPWPEHPRRSVTVLRDDLDALLAVAAVYLSAFTDGVVLEIPRKPDPAELLDVIRRCSSAGTIILVGLSPGIQ